MRGGLSDLKERGLSDLTDRATLWCSKSGVAAVHVLTGKSYRKSHPLVQHELTFQARGVQLLLHAVVVKPIVVKNLDRLVSLSCTPRTKRQYMARGMSSSLPNKRLKSDGGDTTSACGI